ncbi:MAG: MarR family transcriptional regulator [Zavarzinia sp.]|nr:MarR family transcriptional regulator [Zavarzinia sp.]
MSVDPDITRLELGPLLGQTSRLWRRAVDKGLRPFGLTEASWLPLLHLARAPTAMRQKQLADSLSLDGSAVVRILDTLEAAGLIERHEDSDRRAKVIVLTTRGERTVALVESVACQARDAALAGLSPDDIEAASRVMRHIRGNLGGGGEA